MLLLVVVVAVFYSRIFKEDLMRLRVLPQICKELGVLEEEKRMSTTNSRVSESL